MLIVFSDTHLTHHWFNPKKFRYLANIIRSADQVAIVGDFWDGMRCSFDQFIQSPWKALFPLLKSKDAIYLYGNHDLEEWCDERVNRFSTLQAEAVDITVGTFNLRLEHGHRIAPDPITKNPKLLNIPMIGWADYIFTSAIPMVLFGDRWAKVSGRVPTHLMRERAKWASANGQWLICGHSHSAQVDPAIRYANSGFVGSGWAKYLRVDEYSIDLINARF
ncbi:MAG TPA: hypothetical protein ENI09_01190 [candidate division WWE3 bacterium]|uniref:Calcineurin-like phosphoesterase domain-containing protein n=1 Tax=candidate division WWE3 bacterium TaxID=2053526 RepID=A0A7C1NKB1_UNCKA|nr:hypothetical protein [candidate division WWE3 bacterium]